MPERRKVLIFLDADIVVRHFIESAVFAPLIAAHDVTFVFLDPSHPRMGIVRPELLDLHGAPFVVLPPDQHRAKIWSELYTTDRLRRRPGRQYKVNRQVIWQNTSWKGRLLYGSCAWPGFWPVFQRWQMSRLAERPNQGLEDLMDEHRPDLVVHPCVLNGIFINDLIETCRKRGVPNCLIMNSWDNPATKQAMVGAPDLLLVWGEQTAEHAARYMGMSRDHVIIFGAAQFDVYRHPPRLDRAAFCRLHGIDPSKRILLYAGSSKETDEFGHLRAIEDAIDGEELHDVAVIYRPHPWGNGGKDGARIIDQAWRHVHIEHSMIDYLRQVKKGNFEKSLPDYRNTRDLLAHVDALMSPMSTIIVEAAMAGTPVMCFIPDDEAEDAAHLRVMLPSTHFDAIYDIPEILVARDRKQMIGSLPALIRQCDDVVVRKRLADATRFIVETFDEPWGERFVRLVESICESRNPPIAA